MTVMALHNIGVDKLLKLKLARTVSFYPTIPTFDNSFRQKKKSDKPH